MKLESTLATTVLRENGLNTVKGFATKARKCALCTKVPMRGQQWQHLQSPGRARSKARTNRDTNLANKRTKCSNKKWYLIEIEVYLQMWLIGCGLDWMQLKDGWMAEDEDERKE